MEVKHVDIRTNGSNSISNLDSYYLALKGGCYLCHAVNVTTASSGKSMHQNVSDWQEVLLLGIFCILIVVTIIGNTLVILAVTTTRRLKTVTNCFVMSLAIADLLVGIFVMPPAVAVHLEGSWQLGWILCEFWISLDILLCTASILSLCAISIDRYLAVIQPIKYSRKRRSKRLALAMILIVWFMALVITCPPIFGWYELGRKDMNECRYNRNGGYVIFSAMGSFFIPMAVMIYVYARIFCVVASRHDKMAYVNIYNKKLNRCSAKDEEETPRRDTSIQNISSRREIQISEREFTSSPDECVNLKNNELTNMSIKRQLSVTSNTFTSFDYHFPHVAIKENRIATTPLTNDSYITKNIKIYHQKSIPNRLSLLKTENKTTRTLSIVMGGFIACWLPFFIYYLITPFLSRHQINQTLTNVLTWLGWFNSAINPFIYAFYNVDFRAAFWRLTLKRFF